VLAYRSTLRATLLATARSRRKSPCLLPRAPAGRGLVGRGLPTVRVSWGRSRTPAGRACRVADSRRSRLSGRGLPPVALVGSWTPAGRACRVVDSRRSRLSGRGLPKDIHGLPPTSVGFRISRIPDSPANVSRIPDIRFPGRIRLCRIRLSPKSSARDVPRPATVGSPRPTRVPRPSGVRDRRARDVRLSNPTKEKPGRFSSRPRSSKEGRAERTPVREHARRSWAEGIGEKRPGF